MFSSALQYDHHDNVWFLSDLDTDLPQYKMDPYLGAWSWPNLFYSQNIYDHISITNSSKGFLPLHTKEDVKYALGKHVIFWCDLISLTSNNIFCLLDVRYFFSKGLAICQIWLRMYTWLVFMTMMGCFGNLFEHRYIWIALTPVSSVCKQFKT